MKLRHQIILYALIPFFLTLGAITATLYWQDEVLEQLQRGAAEQAYKASKDAELKNYIELAMYAIADLYGPARAHDVAAMDKAKAILSGLHYGSDGYFFVYDLQGRLLMHPHKPELVNQNLWEFKDANGTPVIQQLVKRAREGGGFEEFLWPKPSTHMTAPVLKRAYVVVLPHWGWVLGTGIYLDDMDSVLARDLQQASKNLQGRMFLIITISGFCVGTIVALLMWNIHARTKADAQLRALARRIVRTQDDERSRITNALHDSIKPMLGAIKLKLELGIEGLAKLTHPPPVSPNKFVEAVQLVDDTAEQIKQMIRGDDLRPRNLSLLGLEGSLRQWAYDANSDTIRVEFKTYGETKELSNSANEALLLIAQEAVTNARNHSKSTQISIQLKSDARSVTLTIHDDGHGFDVSRLPIPPDSGLGLHNMKARVEVENGTFHLMSSSSGTTIIAMIPARD